MPEFPVIHKVLREKDQMISKHSLTIAGHVTSVSLEDIFWQTLKSIAQERGCSLQVLIADIDQNREDNLSSAIRVFVLEWALARVKNQ